jgi:CelD/BcsL family acetyltransferase involved in cellulose biosynthesis
LNLETFTEKDVFSTLSTEWNDLLQRSSTDLIFLTLQWQQTWWDAYHPGELHLVTARDDDGRLLGIAPWFIQQLDGERVIRTVGCVDVTDYLGIIADRDHEPAFLESLAAYLTANQDAYDRISLCNIPKAAPILEHWPAMLTQQDFQVEIEQQEVCPVITLPASWDEYLSNLNKKQRHEIRRKIRRASGSTDWYIVGPDHDLDAEIEKFLVLMAASSEEKAAFLQDEAHVTFFKNMVPRIMEAGWLQLIFLTADGEPAAAYLNFDRNNRIMVYNSGQNIEQFGALSAGIVLLAHAIRHAIEAGRDEFDFLRGDETYKYQMGGQDTTVFKLKASRNKRS